MSQSSYETETIEHKQSLTDWRDIVESIAAFATAGGGAVLVGVSPSGQRVGVQVGRHSLEGLSNQIKDNTDPPQYPSIDIEGDEAAAILTVRIQESPVKPVWAFGRPLKRVGRTNQRLSPEETRRLMEVTTGRTWDALPCLGFGLDDVDREAVAAFLRRAGQDAGASTESVLQNLNLLTPEGLCHAAALLFARNPQRYVGEAQVKCARFQGTTSIRFLDQQTFEGNVTTQLEAALAFVARNTRQEIRITGRPQRDVIPEYPEEAVREAVTNAICHRDYAATANVQVRVYDDRLEVWNPGVLPPGLTVESLYREHASHPRNPRLATALYRARYIERWGTGTLRIIGACEAAGTPAPEFRAEMRMFIVRFPSPAARTLPATPPSLYHRQPQVLAYVHEHGSITPAHYSALLGVSHRQAQRELAKLVELGVLVRRGTRGRGTRYTLPEGLHSPSAEPPS